MIEGQIAGWVITSLVSGLIAYLILTEGKSKFLLVLTFLFDLFFGIATSYLWLQTTKGLAMYDWALFILPALFSTVATILLLSYYMAYHPKQSLPRIPAFKVSTTASAISFVVIVALAIMVSATYFPIGATSPSIATLGSETGRTLTASDVIDSSVCLSCLPSSDITIQKSVVTPWVMRNNPKKGELLNFKVQFKPKISYAEPSMVVFIQDSTGKLIPDSKIYSYNMTSNTLEGQILCDTPGIYNITAVTYDLASSGNIPLSSTVESYTVYDTTVLSPEEAYNSIVIMFLFAMIAMVGIIFAIALWKKYV